MISEKEVFNLAHGTTTKRVMQGVSTTAIQDQIFLLHSLFLLVIGKGPVSNFLNFSTLQAFQAYHASKRSSISTNVAANALSLYYYWV